MLDSFASEYYAQSNANIMCNYQKQRKIVHFWANLSYFQYLHGSTGTLNLMLQLNLNCLKAHLSLLRVAKRFCRDYTRETVHTKTQSRRFQIPPV